MQLILINYDKYYIDMCNLINLNKLCTVCTLINLYLTTMLFHLNQRCTGRGPEKQTGTPEFEVPANVVQRGRRIDRGVYSSGKGPRTDALLFIILVDYYKPPQGPTAPAGTLIFDTVFTNFFLRKIFAFFCGYFRLFLRYM